MIIYLFVYLINLILIGEDVGRSLILISKLLTSILFFTYFLQVNNTDRDYFLQKAKFIFTISFVIFSVNMLLGMLGYGFSSYENGIGTCGFFYALNELSGVLAVLSPWMFYYCKTKLTTLGFYICSAFLFLLSFALGSKSGIVATIMFFFLINYSYGEKRERLIMIILFVVIAIIGVIYIQQILSANLPVIERFAFFVEKQGFVDALTSNRLHFWEDRSRDFFRSGLIVWIFGLGGQRTVEMDPFDALLNCGLVGFAVILFLYWKLIAYPLEKRNESLQYSKVIFSSNLLLVLISVGGGHILFSSMAGMLIALSNAILFGKRTIFNSRESIRIILAKRLLMHYK